MRWSRAQVCFARDGLCSVVGVVDIFRSQKLCKSLKVWVRSGQSDFGACSERRWDVFGVERFGSGFLETENFGPDDEFETKWSEFYEERYRKIKPKNANLEVS